MGCRILIGHEQGDDRDKAVLFCSTSMWAFGPVFESEEQAERFLKWCPVDPRKYTKGELMPRWAEFIRQEPEIIAAEERWANRCMDCNVSPCECPENGESLSEEREKRGD